MLAKIHRKLKTEGLYGFTKLVVKYFRAKLKYKFDVTLKKSKFLELIHNRKSIFYLSPIDWNS
ncbi:MAG: hypothetical protein ACP5P7_05490, partial [Sulfurihydrogenibium sp.]